MDKDDVDYHIDPRLEKLFHGNVAEFNLEDGGADDVIVADSLPEWLIGVIVVIVLLVIAFFIMVISTILKNKRENQSASSSDLSSHICDDLELGKISMVDPRTDAATLVSEDKHIGLKTSDTYPQERFDRNSQKPSPEPCCSSSSNDGSNSMCAYKNPLFVDDETGMEQEGGQHSININIDKSYKSKGKSHKHKSTKSIACKDLKSVQEMYEEERPGNANTTPGNIVMNSKEFNTGKETLDHCHSNATSQSSNAEENCNQVIVHNSNESNSSSERVPSSKDHGRLNYETELTCSRLDSRSDIEHTANDDEYCEGEETNTTKGEERISAQNSHDHELVSQPSNHIMQDSESTDVCTDIKRLETENPEQHKSQRFSFIRVSLSDDGCELDNEERTYTKL